MAILGEHIRHQHSEAILSACLDLLTTFTTHLRTSTIHMQCLSLLKVLLVSKYDVCVCVAGVHLSPLESSDLTAHNHTLCITVRCVCLRYHGNTPVCYPCVTRLFSAHAACVTACWAAERARRRGGRTAAWWSKCSVVVLR